MAGQRIQLQRYSMFASTPVYEPEPGLLVFGLMQPPVVPDATDFLYTVTSAGVPRLDLIANEQYGTPSLWWVIASVNNIIDPLVSVPQGTTLRMPTKDRLSAEGVLNV
jgi:hypothetical protein